ncbi:nuclear transport factor 2 family protein [Robertkochia flava]|uniref:nuclear transport factor 2 family protein n=1 Tax=Robertkochia flava TaxID=3447986 RepID=UPI001CCA69F9|nr:nuclear transport factor 2 family protein [Robertkochia marina]
MKRILCILILLTTVCSCEDASSEYSANRLRLSGQRPPRTNPDIPPAIKPEIKRVGEAEIKLSPFEAEMALLDSLFYTRAYNQKDTALARKMIHQDFEFYHDRTGILDDRNSRAASEMMIQRFQTIGDHYRRKLKPGTLQSFPLYDGKKLYGALQRGINQYHQAESGDLEGNGKFIHLWVKEGEDWKLKRVISYDHEAISQ